MPRSGTSSPGEGTASWPATDQLSVFVAGDHHEQGAGAFRGEPDVLGGVGGGDGLLFRVSYGLRAGGVPLIGGVGQYSGTSTLPSATSSISSDSGFSRMRRARTKEAIMNGTDQRNTVWKAPTVEVSVGDGPWFR